MRRIWLVLVLFGCEARIDGPRAIDAAPPSDEPPPFVAPSREGWPNFVPTETVQLRRLTRAQYLASVQSLLGVSVAGAPPIEPVAPVAGFEAIGASGAVVSANGVSQFEDAANFFAKAALATSQLRQRAVGCTPSSAADTACFRSFVQSFGQRAFRRPLGSDEIDRYATLAGAIATEAADPWVGIESVIAAFLQSPNFLYLPEVGELDPTAPALRRFTAYELASRLSYFFTNDAPDAELLAAAGSGALHTPAGLAAEIDRMVASPSASAGVREFFGSLLSLQLLDTLARPTAVFPKFTPSLGQALKEETLLNFEELFTKDGEYRAAFDQRSTFVNAELASFYGVPAPASGFARVALPVDSHRAGLLGQAGVLAVRDHADGTSPTRRGLFVLTRLLCQNIPLEPPAGLVFPPAPTGLTARQRMSEHSSNAGCAACHKAMDGVGLSLEKFDALGVYRETERGEPIDDSGQLSGTAYQGEVGLAGLLRDAPALGPCLIQALYGSSIGRPVSEFDRAAFTQLAFGHGQSLKLKALFKAVAMSDGFRRPPTEATP